MSNQKETLNFEFVSMEETDRADIEEVTKTVFDGEDYWLNCLSAWKATESLFETDDKTGATYAHGLRLVSENSPGPLVALNAVQFVDNTFCWCMALRSAPSYRGKGAGGRVFALGLDWARKRGVNTFGMSTVSINSASMAIGTKYGFKIAPEWNLIAMKRSFPSASSLLTGPTVALSVFKPSEIVPMLKRLVLYDASEWQPDQLCFISTSWAYTTMNQRSLEVFLDPCCKVYTFSGENSTHKSEDAALIEQFSHPNFIRDGPKDWKNGVLEFWWTIYASSEEAAQALLLARQQQLHVYRTSHSKIRIWLFIPPRLIKAATALKWDNDPKKSYLLHCLLRNEA